MTDNPSEARVFVIGVLQVSDELELRCVLEPWGWRPDILINQRTKVVSPPPECFELAPEAEAALNEALYGLGREVLPDES